MIIYSPTNPSATTINVAGRPTITVLNACRQIEEMYAIPSTAVKRKLIRALLNQQLEARDEGGFRYQPEDVLDISVAQIDVDDLNKYLATENPNIQIDRKDQNDYGTDHHFSAPHYHQPENEVPVVLPKKVQEVRIEIILSVLQRQHINPMCVPKGWKNRVKNECLLQPKLFSDSTFDSAWKDASKSRQLRADGYDRYIEGRRKN